MTERHPSDPPTGNDRGARRPHEGLPEGQHEEPIEEPMETLVRRWLDLEADGALAPDEAQRLESALEARPELAAELADERQALGALQRELAAARIAVRPGFRDAVMRALPQAAWEPAGRRGWGVATAVAALLAAGGALAFALAGIGGTASGSLVGLVTTIGELVVASVVTGAGLLGASWRGVGLALEELLAASPSTVVVLGLAVVLLNVLFWRLLRRDPPRPAPADRD